MKRINKIILVILIIFAIFLTILVKKYDVLAIDQFFLEKAVALRNGFLTKIVKVVTNLGGTFWIIFLTLICLILIKKRKYPILITVNILNVVIINQLLKIIIQRSRPIVEHLVNESGYSYPSGHAMAAIGFYGFFIFLINNLNIDEKLKKILTSFLICLIILIGLTSISLGVHYFTDIIAGFTFGLIYLMLYTNFIKKYLKHE